MSSLNQPATPRVHLRAFSRLWQIHQQISADGCPTIRTLALLTERSERTIKRDLRAMQEDFNAPLYFDRERKGWRYRELGWSPPPVRLSEGELLAFFTAEQALRATGQTPEATLLRAGLAKLAAWLPEEVTVNLHTLGAALTFQPSPHVLVEPSTLQALARAAAHRRTVTFNYYSPHRDQHTQREADVLLLHNFASDWYAIAFDHLRGEVRDFHAGRISHLRVTSRYFDPPADWNADAYLRSGFCMMRGGRRTTVEIIFDAYQARWVRERQTFHPEEQREELLGGELRLSFPVGRDGLDAVARFCLTYAGHCRAERPAALRKMIREQLTLALDHHREKRDANRK